MTITEFIAARLDEAQAVLDASAADSGYHRFFDADPTTEKVICEFAVEEQCARDVAADRALLGALDEARKFSDHMFSSSSPEGVASGEVLGERMRAATQVVTLERVVAIRAARFSTHPDYLKKWAP